MRKTVDVIVPAFNEEDCIEELIRRLDIVYSSESNYDFRTIVVENGSTDSTWVKLIELARDRSNLNVVKLSRNFRMDGGLTAGLEYADADAVVLMTADLQDPPEVIPEFLRRWEQGFQNVYAVVTRREGTSGLRALNSRLFYKFSGILTAKRIPENASDFRLLDRSAYAALRSLDERNRFMRALVAWVGFESCGVNIVRPPRFAGESKAYTLPVIGLAIRGIFAHSYIPLHAISIAGVLLSGLAFVLFLTFGAFWIVSGVPFAGFGTLASLLLLGFATILLFLGIISEYLSLIYEEVKGRPNFLVSETLGFDDGGSRKIQARLE